jgi:hypothetical protein
VSVSDDVLEVSVRQVEHRSCCRRLSICSFFFCASLQCELTSASCLEDVVERTVGAHSLFGAGAGETCRDEQSDVRRGVQ